MMSATAISFELRHEKEGASPLHKALQQVQRYCDRKHTQHFNLLLDPSIYSEPLNRCFTTHSRVVSSAVRYILRAQRPDGSWFGSWAICFTYATMFALESLSLAGKNCSNSKEVRKACEFLIGKQKEDGGWGETFEVRTNFAHSPAFVSFA